MLFASRLAALFGSPWQPAPPTPSFRTEQTDFFFRIRSCECVGLRSEKSLFASVAFSPCTLLPASTPLPNDVSLAPCGIVRIAMAARAIALEQFHPRHQVFFRR